MTDSAAEVAVAADRLAGWVERERFRGWDPHDALNSPLIKAATLGNRWLGIAAVQLLRRSSVNLRPLLGVRKGRNPKGMGLFLASYLRLWRLRADPEDRRRAQAIGAWLLRHRAPGYEGFGWGYNFDWPNRGFFAPAGLPTVVNTAFIGLAFLDWHLLAPDLPLATDPLEVARRACDFVLCDLTTTASAPDECWFSYTPADNRCVHNASLLGARLLAEVAAQTGEPELIRPALAAARFSARAQRPDGSWPYGAARRDGWIDNFHTGYVLVALRRIATSLQTDEFDDAIARGYAFWKERLFLADGTPKASPAETYPIDVHSVAQAILTSLEFAEDDPDAPAKAWRLAHYVIDQFQEPDGWFDYHIERRYRIRIPYMRWSQAWVQRALVELLVWNDSRTR